MISTTLPTGARLPSANSGSQERRLAGLARHLAAKSGADLGTFQSLHPQGEGATEFEALMRKLRRHQSS
jgi:hypothetical protein